MPNRNGGDPRADRLLALFAAEDAEIAEKGYAMRGIPPTREGDFHFAYTIGPDRIAIVTGASHSAAGLLDVAMDNMWRPDGIAWEGTGEGHLVAFAPTPNDTMDKYCAGARPARYARQLVWQDQWHRWPWHPGRGPGSPTLIGDHWRPFTPEGHRDS